MPSAPDITFRSTKYPYDVLSSITYSQSKLGSGALPVLHGEESNPILFRVYNNFAKNSGIATAMNVAITTYDGTSSVSHTAAKLPVSQSWIRILEHGFGENSVPTPDLYTRYDGVDTAIGGRNKYYAQKGSNGIYGVPQIRAGDGAKGVGYIEYKSYAAVPDDTVGNLYEFVISCVYEYVI